MRRLLYPNISLFTAGNATSAVINSLVEAKSGIQDAAENFDSKSIIKTTKKRIGNAIVGTIEGAGNLLEQAGVYSAIDSIVHGFAGMPTKVKAPCISKEDIGVHQLNIPTNKESLYP